MRDEDKSKEQLVKELIQIREQIEVLKTIQDSLLTDITEYKQVTENLHKNEKHWHYVSDNMLDMIRFTDCKGIIKYASPSHKNILGYSPQDLVGKSCLCFIHPDDTDKILYSNGIYKQTSYIGKLEYRLRHADGHYLWVETIGRQLLDEDGHGFVIYSSRDITDRKGSEEALRLSEERFAKSFNASPIPMSITTLEEGRFINTNDSFCHVLGYNREEILGKTSLEIRFWLNPADRYEIKQRLMGNNFFRNVDIHFCKKSGEKRLGLYSAERIDINGEPCILNLVTDITERKEMEVEMIRLDRLNLVGEMAASIGHEIRNPMTTVRGYLQILRENQDYFQETEYFDLMIEELDRANSIITEFLSLAKNKTVELTPLNLNSILNNISPLVQANARIQDKGIRLILEDIPDLLGNEKEIRQLIFNLVHNGLESMSTGGNVTISTFVKNNNLVLSVQDQGCGIDHDSLNKLGTPFFTTKENGTGLGLAVCYGIAQRHNATINIETGSAGSTFNVIFPQPNFYAA